MITTPPIVVTVVMVVVMEGVVIIAVEAVVTTAKVHVHEHFQTLSSVLRTYYLTGLV